MTCSLHNKAKSIYAINPNMSNWSCTLSWSLSFLIFLTRKAPSLKKCFIVKSILYQFNKQKRQFKMLHLTGLALAAPTAYPAESR